MTVGCRKRAFLARFIGLAGLVLAGSGVSQSPVDITEAIEANLAPLVFDYTSDSIDIINNDHTLQANAERGSTLSIRDVTVEKTGEN